MDEKRYDHLNDCVMAVLYSPLLVVTAFIEQREARVVRYNRKRGEADEDVTHEWEQVLHECDFEADGWDKKVQSTKPNVEFDTAVLEVKKLQGEVRELKDLLVRLVEKSEGWGNDTLGASGFEKLKKSGESGGEE
jgi:hypothetical protein